MVVQRNALACILSATASSNIVSAATPRSLGFIMSSLVYDSGSGVSPPKRQRAMVNLATTTTSASASTEQVDAENASDEQKQPDLELLSAWFCPYAQRAWIAMSEKCPGQFKLTEAMKTVPPDDHYEKIPLLLESNPNALVPVIIDRRNADDGDTSNGDDDNNSPAIVYESLICVEYVDEALGSSPNTLLPGPPGQRAEARMWADKLNKQVSTPFYRLLMKQTKEEQDKAAELILDGLKDFSRHCKGPFFFGNAFTLVDISLAPWAVGIRMDILKHYRSFEVPKTEEYATYHEWSEAVSQRPSFLATACTDLPAMISIYRRYAEGTALSKVGDAVRGGHAMP